MTGDSAIKADRPILTIAVPTYNRATLLCRLLSTLFEQIGADSRVELIVSDNASTDNTPEVVQSFRDCGKSFRSIRNSENIGPDRNILQCFEAANGKYVWIFGDDDMLEPGGLATVLTYMSADEYDLIYVSAKGYRGKYVPKTRVSSKGGEVFNRPEEFARRLHVMFTFISANIVNRDRVSAVNPEPFGELSGTGLGHLAWIYAALNSLRKSLLIKDELVAGLMDNSGGYSVFEVFGPNFRTILEARIKSKAVRNAIIGSTLLGYLPSLILDAKRNDNSSFRSQPASALRTAFGNDPRYWIFDVPVTVLPKPLDHLWVRFGGIATKLEYLIRWRLFGRNWGRPNRYVETLPSARERS